MALRRARVLAVALAMAALVPAAALAQAPDPGALDAARQRLEQLEGQAATATERLAAARDELDALTPRLRTTSEQLDQAEAEAAKARRAAVDARHREQRVLERLAEARERLSSTRDELAELARDAYKYGPGAATPLMAAIEQLSTASDPNEIADVVHMVDVVLGDRALLIEESVRLIEETAILKQEAKKVRAAREREAAVARRAEKKAARQHATMLALLDEADRAVAVEHRALAQVRAHRSGTKERIADLEAARARAAAEAKKAIAITPAGEGLVTVGGITVAESLGPRLEALLEAARVDGIVLGGYGYRSPETTERLRRANGCPDVHTSPASSCRVPTARPGTSMHEKGLAVDFTHQGETICYPNPASRCSGNAAFDWLQAHAGEYGLQVLSSEAWHWSTNGR